MMMQSYGYKRKDNEVCINHNAVAYLQRHDFFSSLQAAYNFYYYLLKTGLIHIKPVSYWL